MNRKSAITFAGAALAAAWLAFPAASQAQGGSMDVGNARISVGAGVEKLYLPDVKFTSVQDAAFNTLFKQENSDTDDTYGYAVNGELLFPGREGSRVFSLQGFYGSISDDDTVVCNSVAAQACGWAEIVPVAAGKVGGAPGQSLTAKTDRDIDHWGASFEGRRALGGYSGGMKDGPMQRARYLALGADIRGLYQDISLNAALNPGVGALNYNEDLDTTYYGVFLAYGGDYQLPFFKGATSGLGLKSSFRLWGGIYYADTEYRGNLVDTVAPGFNQTLSLSREDAAFIGGLTLETRKAIGERASLSLRSDYTYYSYVPDMQYNDIFLGGGAQPGNQGTRIGDDHAFSTRTTLRLNIALGPRDVVQPYK